MPTILNEAPPWKPDRCRRVILLHGCTELDRLQIEASGGIDLKFSRPDLDFGRGFYTTMLRRQAEHWATKRFDSGVVSKKGNWPVVLSFTVPRDVLSRPTNISFVTARYDDEDFWSLVQHCRRSRRSKGGRLAVVNDHGGPILEAGGKWFDVISGPVAADWRQRSALQDMDQLSFHTNRSIEILNQMVRTNDLTRYSWQRVNP